MGDKPYLQIEVDEHFSPVGVITRIEAFLQSLEGRPAQPLPAGFSLTSVVHRPTAVAAVPERTGGPLLVPDLPPFTAYLRAYCEAAWETETRTLRLDSTTLPLGRAETSSKEYLPFPALLGGVLTAAEAESGPFQVLLPSTQGAEADGQYPWGVETVLERQGLCRVKVIAPELETLPERCPEPDLLFRAFLVGDLLLCAPPEQRDALAPAGVPGWAELETLAAHIGAIPPEGRTLGIVGEPFTLFTLHDGVPDTLEQEGWRLLRAPLSEYLWFLWRDAGSSACREWAGRVEVLGRLLGPRSSFSPELESLRSSADRLLPGFSGANGRHRLAKGLELGGRCAGVLTMAPRYENTTAILEMTGALDGVPHFHLAMDHDWDEAARSRLRSFLYYLS